MSGTWVAWIGRALGIQDAVFGTATGTAGAAHDCAGAGRWPGFASEAADRPPRQTGGVLRRQVPHHRFRAVELPQLEHPADRGADSVQGAQPAAPHADGLVVPAPGNERIPRYAAGPAADRR